MYPNKEECSGRGVSTVRVWRASASDIRTASSSAATTLSPGTASSTPEKTWDFILEDKKYAKTETLFLDLTHR